MSCFPLFVCSSAGKSVGRTPSCERLSLVPSPDGCLPMGWRVPVWRKPCFSSRASSRARRSCRPSRVRIGSRTTTSWAATNRCPAGVPSDWAAAFDRNPRMGSFVIHYETIKGRRPCPHHRRPDRIEPREST